MNKKNIKNNKGGSYNNNLIADNTIKSKIILSKQNNSFMVNSPIKSNIISQKQNNNNSFSNLILNNNNENSEESNSNTALYQLSKKMRSNDIRKSKKQISNRLSKNPLTSKIINQNESKNISGVEIYKALLLHFKVSGIFLLKEQVLKSFPSEIDISSLKNIIDVNKEVYELINNRVINENLLTIKASSRSKLEKIETDLQWAQAIIELYDFALKFQQTFDNQKLYLEKKHYSTICDNQSIKKCKYPCTKLVVNGNTSATCTFK
jgi:hypothetical protein